MKRYKITDTERKTLPEEVCLRDFISELYAEAKAKKELAIFILNAEAFRKMCASPSKKEIVFFSPFGEVRKVSAVWLACQSDHIEFTDRDDWIQMEARDHCKEYFVEEVKTEKMKYNCPRKGSVVVCYTIE